MNLTHRRYNPLINQWVLVSPNRASRPWQGDVDTISTEFSPTYDPNCYLCPGNIRANGQVNPKYSKTFVFDNDFPALTLNENSIDDVERPLFKTKHETGMCRVVCFSPKHNLTLPELSNSQIEDVLETWTQQTVDLFSKKGISYVQVFENKGAQMGCSNPHPHSQIWSQSQIPNEPYAELISQKNYYNENGSPLLMDYVKEELKRNERVILSNDHFTCMVLFWAVWPFEVLITAHRPVAYLAQLSTDEVSALVGMIKQITIKYDNLFNISFPY